MGTCAAVVAALSSCALVTQARHASPSFCVISVSSYKLLCMHVLTIILSVRAELLSAYFLFVIRFLRECLELLSSLLIYPGVLKE